jgi:hypothetical protein
MTTDENPNGPEAQNPRVELAQWAKDNPPLYGRKLSFSEKCGIAYALHSGGVMHKDVREAFNLSPATVSLLANALGPDGRRYRDVWEEFEALGEDAFAEKHYFPLHMRFKRVRAKTHLAAGDIAPKQTGPDPRAQKYAGEQILPDGSRWQIFYSDDTGDKPRGYYFTELPEGVHLTPGKGGVTDRGLKTYGAEALRGALTPEPFRTSADAFDGLYEINGYSNLNPRPKPGRPRL